jgi:hypothetical protein
MPFIFGIEIVEDGKLRDVLVDGPKRFESIPSLSDYPE